MKFTPTSPPAWVVLAVLVVAFLDYASTVQGLRLGLVEMNPLMTMTIEATGLVGLFAVKFALTGLVLYLFRYAGPAWPWAALVFFAPTGYAVVNNFYHIVNAA